MLTNPLSGNGGLALHPTVGGAAAGARGYPRHRDTPASFGRSFTWLRRGWAGALALRKVVASAFGISAAVENAPPRSRRSIGLAWFEHTQSE
jgi:hypothetical protein